MQLDGTTVERLHLLTSPSDILAVVATAPTAADKLLRMEWLKQNRNKVYYVVLGMLYDVAVYEVDGTGGSEGCPEDEKGLFFASTNAEDFPDAPSIPLTSTFEDTYRVACNLLGIETLLHRECEVGHTLPRRCQLALGISTPK